DMRKGRWWLDIFFPDGPPQEYARLGIEITNDYVALVRRPVDQRDHQRLLRTLMPSAALASVYATARYIFHANLDKARKAVGLPTSADRQTAGTDTKSDERAQNRQQSPTSKAPDVLSKSFRDQNPHTPAEDQRSDASQPPQNSPAFQMPRTPQ